jgi:transcriptional regulator with XRE-family HTH domain
MIIMKDNFSAALLGQQIRALRESRGWTLAELGRRAATSAPTLHRYESGWDAFELATLRKIAAALGARLEVRLVGAPAPAAPAPTAAALVRLLAPLFWDRDLGVRDLSRHGEWVLKRVLQFGNRAQVVAARRFFGDDAIRRAAGRRGIDARTRGYWRLILGRERHASEGAQR